MCATCLPARQHEGSLEPYRQNCDESGLQISPPDHFAVMIYLTVGNLDIPAQILSHLRTLGDRLKPL